MRHRPPILLTTLAIAASVVATASWGVPAVASSSVRPGPKLIHVSSDPYQGDGAQHATEAEPDTFSTGKTVVSVFQTGRFSNGGSTNTGWATSTDKGKRWKHGFMPGITTAEGGKWARVSDPAVAYDAKHQLWLASGLVLDANVDGRGVVVNSSTDGVRWKKPVLVTGNNGSSYDKEWIACDSFPKSPSYGNCYVEVDLTSSGAR